VYQKLKIKYRRKKMRKKAKLFLRNNFKRLDIPESEFIRYSWINKIDSEDKTRKNKYGTVRIKTIFKKIKSNILTNSRNRMKVYKEKWNSLSHIEKAKLRKGETK
jgi:hypothetical protein